MWQETHVPLFGSAAFVGSWADLGQGLQVTKGNRIDGLIWPEGGSSFLTSGRSAEPWDSLTPIMWHLKGGKGVWLISPLGWSGASWKKGLHQTMGVTEVRPPEGLPGSLRRGRRWGRTGGPLSKRRRGVWGRFLPPGGQPLRSSPPSTRISALGATYPHANQHPGTSPLPAGPPSAQPLPRTKKELESLSSSLLSSFREPVGRGRDPFWWLGQGAREGAWSWARLLQSAFSTPHCSPREPAGNRKCLLPGLAGETEKGSPLCSALAAP